MANTKETERNERTRLLPQSAIYEEDGKVILVLEMPGTERGDVSISVENDELKIAGKRSVPTRKSTYLIRERRIADYYSSFTIDETIDRDRIDAEAAHGVLTITLHLKEVSKPKQIAVREVT